MATAHESTNALRYALNRRGIDLSFEDANTLRRAALTLQHWADKECGDSDNYRSWAIERDEKTGRPYVTIYPHDSSKVHRYPTPDREKGALRRVVEVCERNGLHFYHQTDPRGCALWVSLGVLTDTDYHQGVSCCTD